MLWLERKIRRYEHRRWTTDDNRRVQPFHWGLEHIDGSPAEPNPAAFLREYARKAIESSREWYAASPAADYRLDRENVLTFTSSIESPWPENNTVHARLFPARSNALRSHVKKNGPAVLVLPNWNAKWHGQNGLCHWIQRLGITVLKMSMPYHDRRMARGHERADQICGPNIGLTLQANRQAVQDARRCLYWAASTGSRSRATPSSASSVPASALPSATSLSFTTSACALAASSTSPRITLTSSARA